MIVIWIQYLCDGLRKIFLFNRSHICTLVKFVKIEMDNRFSIPDTKCIYHIVSVSYNWHIIRNGIH